MQLNQPASPQNQYNPPVSTVIPIHRGLVTPRASNEQVSLALAKRQVRDQRNRSLHDLRISVTDKCNFRCTYCMPKSVFGPGYKFLPQADLLSFEEITRFAKLARSLGVEKIRITGGEPLLRRNLPTLIEQLKQIDGLEITLTTNGSLLKKHAPALKSAGLDRLTVSLDSLDDAVFRSMNDVDFPVADVLDGIAAAQAAGFAHTKVNMVVKRGLNDHTIVDFMRHFKGSGVIARTIEFMDVGSSNGWRMDDVVPSSEVVARINAVFPLEACDPNYSGEVAERWRYVDGSGEIGVISSVTQAFCSTCTRARLSTDGKLYTCLFATEGHEIRQYLRDGSTDATLLALLAGLWQQRGDQYSEIRTAETASLRALKKVEMSYIGG
jgi:GTP 3',8-cyclase